MLDRLPNEFIEVNMRLATEGDKHIPAFDNTKLTAINTCPTWGLLRYDKHKVFSTASRSMALEAGAAAHEVYAAIRLLDVFENQGATNELWQYHGKRLFGLSRHEEMMQEYNSVKDEDERTRIMNYALTALYNSGFYDDPRDKRRTVANIEEACIAYIDRYEWGKNHIWIRDNTASSDIGVEVPFDIVLSFLTASGNTHDYRFTGKIDGIHYRKDRLTVAENKTASRLNDAWSTSFEMSHQVTGYALAASLWCGEPVYNADIYGMSIPLPRGYDYGGIVREPVTRTDEHFAHWFRWFWHTVGIWHQHRDDIINAPRYTHSCNRYFQPCSFIPFCAAPDAEKEEIMSEMETDEWSPLDEKSGDR